MSTEVQGESRPSMRTLDDKLALLRAEQRTQHVITRALVVVLATPNVAKAVPYVLGAVGIHWSPW